jgi:hypothetical protein
MANVVEVARRAEQHSRRASVAPRPQALTLALIVALSAAAPLTAQPAILSGRVLHGAAEQPVVGAIVELAALGLSTRTDSLGRYRFSAVPAGEHQVAARAIGYDRWVGALRFSASDTVGVDILLGTALTKLATMRITAEANDRWTAVTLREFEDRRRTGLGRFLTKDYFEANEGQSVGSLIARRFAGLRHNGKSGYLEAVSIASRGRNCVPNIVLNGIQTNDFSIGLLQATEILGFEFHTATTLPAQYNMTGRGCGTFIIWTK